MKIRKGFVSNSSTTSFIVELQLYDSVFSLAKKLIKIITDDKYKELNLEKQDKYEFKSYSKKLEIAESKSIDNNTPIMFPTYNFDTYIIKKNDGYYVDTDHILLWEMSLKTIKLDFDLTYNLIEENLFFYILKYDVFGKFIKNPMNIPCKNHNYPYNSVELSNRKLICLECERQKGTLKEFKIANLEDPIDSFKINSIGENSLNHSKILNEFKYKLNEMKKRKLLEEKHWIELYIWGIKIFSEEAKTKKPIFKIVSEVSSYLIEIGKQHDWKMVMLGKYLLASILSFSEDIKDIDYSISLFEEIKFRMQSKMPEFYSTEYYRKAVNKKLNYNRGEKIENSNRICKQ